MTATPHSIDRRALLRRTVTIAGAAVALPSLASLAGCTAPASFDDHIALVSAISERIIPATDTLGAIEAGVPAYIAAVFDQHFTAQQQSEFLAGLALIGDTGFADSAPAARDEILTRFANGGAGESGSAIFQQLRDLVIFGFYTSEAATSELSYEELPGRYDGCVPMAEIGRAWLDRGV